MKPLILTPLLLALALPAGAEVPEQVLSRYVTEAGSGFTASAERGRQFYRQKRSASDRMPSCATCHTDAPSDAGRHVVTGKMIAPLAPVAGSARFTDHAKAEKWFGRNCKEVVGRECTAAEKADLLRFLMTSAGV